MNLFLDTSVVLASIGSTNGASRWVTQLATQQKWQLVVSNYVVREVENNLDGLLSVDIVYFNWLKTQWIQVDDVVTFAWVTIFEKSKDRPVLFTALAYADVLLTLDQEDFGAILNTVLYGLKILKPGTFLLQERMQNRL